MSDSKTEKKEEKDQVMTLKVPVIPDTEEDREIALNSVMLYRQVATKVSCALAALDVAHSSGGVSSKCMSVQEPVEFKGLLPALKEVFGDGPYETWSGAIDRAVRREAPSWNSDTVQECSREILKRWTSKDPIKSVSRRFLVHQAERGPVIFRNAPLKIKFCPTSPKNVVIEKHVIKIRWDGVGYIAFRVFDLDKKRWWMLQKIADGTYAPGGCKLQLRWKDGKAPRFEVQLGFHCPVSERVLEPNRCLEVAFGSEKREEMITMSIREGHRPSRGMPVDDVRLFPISAIPCLAQLDRIKAQAVKIEAERKGLGRAKKVRRGVQEREQRLTKRRDEIVKYWCHVWSKAVCAVARKWDCGRIEVIGMPVSRRKKDPKEQEEDAPQSQPGVYGRPFQLSTFAFDLSYKAKLEGMEVKFGEGADISEVEGVA